MSVNFSGLARLTSSAPDPNDGAERLAMKQQDLEWLHHRFSEIDTESIQPESNRILYLEQLLRLREPRHLSEAQLTGRRFLLDMLRLLCQLPDVQPAQVGVVDFPTHWDHTLEFKYVVYLMERSARPELAAMMRSSNGISSLNETEVLALREWLNSNGLDAYELAMIQPNFFRSRGRETIVDDQPKIHPLFLDLSKASRERNYDYLAGTFFGLSQQIQPLRESHEQKPNAGLEEAMSSIFDAPFDLKAATSTRLKAFFIPNRHGEPVVALSFLQE